MKVKPSNLAKLMLKTREELEVSRLKVEYLIGYSNVALRLFETGHTRELTHTVLMRLVVLYRLDWKVVEEAMHLDVLESKNIGYYATIATEDTTT